MQKIWRKNFSIPRVDYQMLYPAMEEFYRSQIRLLGRASARQCILIVEQGDNTGTYFLKGELRKLTVSVLDMVMHTPKKIDALHHAAIRLNKKYFAFAKRLERMSLHRLSNRALLRLYERIMRLQRASHGISLPTTWFLDSDGEDFSRYLLRYCEKQIRIYKTSDAATTAFSILTTPRQESFARIEEKELMRLLVVKKEDRRAALQRHYEKWRWTPYTYNGPAYPLQYYLDVVSGLLRQRIQPQKRLREIERMKKDTEKQQREYRKKLHIDRSWQHLFRIAQDIVYIKGFRKDCLYYGCYVRDLILEEAARRLNVTRMQMKYLTPREVCRAFLSGQVNTDESNARMHSSVIAMREGRNTILLGAKAKAFLKKQRFEKEKIVNVKELKGMCASPGRVRGVVTIVNLPEEMSKMQEGNIMVAHTTYPALVPAMKKAAAIVTEDGGVTCHAAIVSRELRTPCIVGIKTVTSVLEDGDRVEVDANHGVVTVVQRA